jgi:GTP cyclohydrolase IIa
MVRATLVQLDNYGPWTVTPEPRREYDLQTLQSRLYADLCQRFGAHGSLTFFSRFDNIVAFTEGVSEDEHRRVQESIGNRYPVTVSVGVADGRTPKEAVRRASALVQSEGSAQDSERKARLSTRTGEKALLNGHAGEDVQVAHFDIEDATRRYTDEVDAYECQLVVGRVGLALMEEMWNRDAATFFVGGDNYVSVAPNLGDEDYDEVLGAVERATGVELKVGVGEGETPAEAGMCAKEGLEHSRNGGELVEFY